MRVERAPDQPEENKKEKKKGETSSRKNEEKTSQKLLVDAHLRHSIGKLQDIGVEDLSGYDHGQPVSILKPAQFHLPRKTRPAS